MKTNRSRIYGPVQVRDLSDLLGETGLNYESDSISCSVNNPQTAYQSRDFGLVKVHRLTDAKVNLDMSTHCLINVCQGFKSPLCYYGVRSLLQFIKERGLAVKHSRYIRKLWNFKSNNNGS